MVGHAVPCLAEAFDRTLVADGFSVRISSPNTAGKNVITLASKGLKSTGNLITVPSKNLVSRAFLADMDGDNSPELFLVLANSGSGSRCEVLAYSTNIKKSLTPIVMGKPAEKDLAGYMGHDEYEVMGNTFVRRFPVYKAGDMDASPTGGYRQIQYKLKPGESAWQMKIDRVTSY